MRKLILAFFALAFSLSAQEKVNVHVTFTNNYCNGARPTPEIEQQYNTPKDLSGYHLILAGKKALTVKTDSAGNFSATLHPGTYKVKLTSKKGTSYTNYDPACAKMLKSTYGVLTVTSEKSYTINLHFPCNPCQPNNKP